MTSTYDQLEEWFECYIKNNKEEINKSKLKKIKRIKYIIRLELKDKHKSNIKYILDYKCELCLNIFDENILDIHHIKQVSKCIKPYDPNVNKENNLLVVCPTCHRLCKSNNISYEHQKYVVDLRSNKTKLRIIEALLE